MVIVSLPGTLLWNGFQAVSLVVLRVVQLVALPAVTQAQILVPAHPAPLEVVQGALPVALLEVSPDFRNRLVEKKTSMPSTRASRVFHSAGY